MPKKATIFATLLVLSSLFLSHYFKTEPAPAPQPPTITIEESPGTNLDVSYEFMATESGTLAINLILEHVEIKTESNSLGYRVTSINGLRANDDHVWQYYINDQLAVPTSVSQTVLAEGDKIRFSYETTEPASQRADNGPHRDE